MRKITAGLFISLDGVVEAPDQWHFPYFNDEMGAAVDATLAAADTILFGRKTSDSFAAAWPVREAAGGEDAPFATALGDARKIVVSNQQLELTWRNSEQLPGDLIEALTALKNEPGDGTIVMSGSVSVVRQLLAAGLLDELHLLVHPIAVRKGMRRTVEAGRSSSTSRSPSRVPVGAATAFSWVSVPAPDAAREVDENGDSKAGEANRSQ
jgi:dihydrofolate reductase